MKENRFTEIRNCRYASPRLRGGVPVLGLRREHGVGNVTSCKRRLKYDGMDASTTSWMKTLEEENRRLKRMQTDTGIRTDMQKEFLKKASGLTCRHKPIEPAVKRRDVSSAETCRAFGVNEACHCHGTKSASEEWVDSVSAC